MTAWWGNLLQGLSRWAAKYHHTMVEKGFMPLLLEGFRTTVLMTLGALAIGVLIGTLVAVIKYFAEDSRPMKPLNWLCDLYVTVIRGVPMVVLLLVFYYVIFEDSKNGVLVATIAFGINSGAYMAELIRSGLNAVDRGQMEAGRSLGMSRFQATRIVIFPQAVRYILPAIGNELIALLKETSVAGYVAVVDVTRAALLVRNNTFDNANPLFTLALVYLVMVIILTRLLGILERRLAKSDKR